MMAQLLVLQRLDEQVVIVYLSLLTIALMMMLLLARETRSKNKPKFPPSAWKLPIIGNLHQLGKLPHRSLQDLSLKHGPLMLLRLGLVPYIVVSSAELAEEFMKTHDLDFANRPLLKPAKKLLYDCTDISFSPYGEYWRLMRKICTLGLLSERRVQSFTVAREEEVGLVIEKISGCCSPFGGVINLRGMFHTLAFNIICRGAMGNKYPESGDGQGNNMGFAAMAGEVEVLLGAMHVGDLFPYIGWVDRLRGLDRMEKKIFHQLDAFLEQVIEDHLEPKREESEQWDMVDVLLGAQKDSTLGITLTRDNLKAIIMVHPWHHPHKG